MALDPAARQRWRTGTIGTVPLASWRGVTALVLIALSVLALLSSPVLDLVMLALGRAPAEQPTITRQLLFLNMVFNTLVLLVLPLLAIIVSRPGEPMPFVARLRLQFDRRTPTFIATGVGVTVLALLVLGTILYTLDKTGLYHAEESELVPQIQALLTWPLVLLLPLVAAVTEEVYFRGFLQPRIGLLASSLFFGLVHIGYGTVLQVVAPVLLGLLFGILFQRTKSLWSAIAAHFTFDFIEFLLLFLDKAGA